QVINETLNFISESMTDVQGYFYSAIAADSEGVEGKYYMWSYKQINQILDKDVGIFSKFYGIDAKNPCNESIMFATQTVKQFAKRHFLNYDDFNQLLINCKKKLLVERNKRLAPTVDKKSITAWNALMLNAFVKAFHITGNTNYIDIAINNATFILNNMKMPDGGLYHVYIDKQPSIEGFLDDYAYTITAFLSLYEVTFNRIYLYEAEKWLEYVIEHFNDENTNFFYYTSNKDDSFLIIRKIEYYDNVIPSANSSLARVLLLLSRIFNKTQWKNRAINMLNSIIYDMIDNPYLYFNWGILLTELIADFYIITIIDKNAINKANKINQYYLPFKFLINDNFFNIELDKEKTLDKKNIYICNDHKCMIAFTNIKDVLKEIKLNCKK
ncbi:MAG TPA: hypothetical protein P5250_01250, partial [Bacteroidales bacterium]|nr:hypothetical protein [Bacteroidales bacterium]